MRTLTMTEKYEIRIMHENEGMSCRAIMKKTGHSFRTVKKYADLTDWNDEWTTDTYSKHPLTQTDSETRRPDSREPVSQSELECPELQYIWQIHTVCALI